MKRLLFAFALAAASSGLAETYEAKWESLDKRPVPSWWTEAKFGIFIHWGPYAVPAFGNVSKDGKFAWDCYAEWYQGFMLKGKKPYLDHHEKFYHNAPYGNFAAQFKAEHFDAAEWAKLFRKAGAKYVVLTSKHHDGYALWPSPESPYYNSVAVGSGRDLAGEFCKAMRDAGLRRGENFVEQTGAREAGLPDVTVFDGAHRKMLIDAKVNIVDFIAATNAAREGDAEAASRLMKEHAKRVRQQVDALAARNYPELMKRADKDAEAVYSNVVVMFMPSEATYFAAVDADPSLVAHANAKKIVIATPQMLFGYILLFKMAIDRVEVARNQEEIARRAKQIVERMDAAFVALEKVGKSLDDAQSKYHLALAKLGMEPGAQNVAVPARELAKLASIPDAPASATLGQA